jgi:MYXO-CTERM domain-containing protein
MNEPQEGQPAAGPRTLDAVLSRPWLIWLVAFTLTALGLSFLHEAHDAFNRPIPGDLSTARTFLMAALVTAVAGLAAACWVARRGTGWFLLTGTVGLILLGPFVFDLFSTWGRSADTRLWEAPLLVVLVLAGIGAWGLRSHFGPRTASLVLTHVAVFFWFPLAVLAFAFYQAADAQAIHASQAEWSPEHADPPPAFWAMAAAVVGTAWWARRRRGS